LEPVTQALLGATVGEACFGRQLGSQAALWGALGGLLPDIDVVLAAFDPMAEFLYHRGPTHAVWFGPCVGTLLGYALWWTRGGRAPGTQLSWIGLMVAALLTHPLLDVFTTYGTQLLTPFSRWRFSLDAVPIIDPFYSLLLLLAMLIGWRAGYAARLATVSAWVALALSTGYLFYGVYLNRQAVLRVRTMLAREGSTASDVRSYPTMFQVYLRRVVVHDGDEVRIGWLSLWNGREIRWDRFRVDSGPEVERVRATQEARTFEWFTSYQTATRVEHRPNGETIVEIGDLRFGFPGQPARVLWGLRARLTRNGEMVGPVERFRSEMPDSAGRLLRELLRATFS
jgi:inner membrane protein